MNQPAPKAAATLSEGPTGLGALLTQGIALSPQREEQLRDAMVKGASFYDKYNESRLELALGGFDEDMRKALFEIIYLLHHNDKSMARFSYTAVHMEQEGTVRRPREVRETADLYVEGAPHGVQGYHQLSRQLQGDFLDYASSTFRGGGGKPKKGQHCAVLSLHSIGSIGSVGHKSGSSDLDLQVVYSLEPYEYDVSHVNDNVLRQYLKVEAMALVRDICTKKQVTEQQMQDPRIKGLVHSAAAQELSRRYPNLHKYLVLRKGDYVQDLKGANGSALRVQCLHEVMSLIKRGYRHRFGPELERQDKLFRERLARIQDYITAKFASAEVYMFPMLLDDYRRGKYSSTVEFKESSGSAYELILNHDTLMAGINFTRIVPTHFIFAEDANNNPNLFGRLNDYIRFHAVNVYDEVRDRLVNLGPVPDLSADYVAHHSGAAYWEAFKASSGNLPKATLNLLRYEMLLHERYLKTVTQLIKNPTALDSLVSPPPRRKGFKWEQEAPEVAGMPPWHLLEIEKAFPKLWEDPWWLRYKALKIAFGEPNGVPGLDKDTRSLVNTILDLAFALHVRISDVFSKPGKRQKFETHRELVLLDYLDRAFPPESEIRKRVETIFSGEVSAVNQFERDMRKVFAGSLERVRKTIAQFNLTVSPINKEEFDIWYHYYRENFQPKPNTVQRTIMNHLKHPRGRLQIGFVPNEGWFFKSLQKESGIGKRFDSYGVLEHLPDTVTLVEKANFMGGLAHCIINGYYGVMNKGTIKERKTALEFDSAHMNLGHAAHNTLGFVRPDQVDRIMEQVLLHFPYRKYNYLDCIRLRREMTEVFIFLNLWQFGRLSFLGRDNLQTFYCDEFDHPELVKDVGIYSKDLEKLARSDPLQRSLGNFLDTRKVLLDKVNLAVWVNPNSIETGHASRQLEKKEEELSRQFEQIIRSIHQ